VEIAKRYGTVVLALDDGEILDGTIKSESQLEFVIITPRGETVAV